ncbi:uncharacterized protein LOC106129217 [Amyelois transitella]|uniref:uncharacterized protein LOC106129217 n=1 Tax=Amyelois transitella TaxID=680683 RepID=UPI00298F8293|nr:uncharacterized protein LOC106129217 [Amyelois transitella]
MEHFKSIIDSLISQSIDCKDPYLQILDNFIEVYSQFVIVEWNVFADNIKDRLPRCLPVIRRLLKRKIRIPELIPTLLKMDLRIWLEDVKMAECFGAALTLECERDGAIQSFRDMLKRVKNSESYIKLLYYSQLGCKEVCDEINFKQVTDQTRKLPKALQNKCLSILSSYISQRTIDYKTSMFETIELSEFLTTDNVEALDLVANGLFLMENGFKRRIVTQALEYCGHSAERVRKIAFKIAAKAFEELYKPPANTDDCAPAPKRPRRCKLSDLANETDAYALSVCARAAAGVTARHSDVTAAVGGALAGGAGERLADCLALMLVGKATEIHACAPFLELFFADLRSNEKFLSCKLRDDPLEPIETKGASNLLTDIKSCRGTLLSYRVTAARKSNVTATTDNTAEIDVDVQVTIDSILEALLQYAKKQPRAGLSLTCQLVRVLPTHNSLPPTLAASLAPSSAPLTLPAARAALAGAEIGGLEEAVSRLRELSSGSDDAGLVQCLHEEIQIRKGCGVFELRSDPMPEQEVMMENTRFTIQDLTSCFCRLSSWDDLTYQQRAVKRIDLPVLWVDEDAFKIALNNYKDSQIGESWFDKMVLSYHEETRNSARWLSDVAKWPRRRFQESAVAEALSWQLEEEPWVCRMSKRDCLVEWSARLMIRAAQANEREAMYPSRSNELLWCVRANEMGLYRGVLQCCDRNNIADLYDEEKISWHHQKLLSLKGMALERNDRDLLRDALDSAVSLTSDLQEITPDAIGIYKQIFLLQQHLNELTTASVNGILEKVTRPTDQDSILNSKSTLTTLYELALVHYDRQWSDDIKNQDEVIKHLANTLYKMRESNVGPADKHLALLLNRLRGHSAGKMADGDVTDTIMKLFYPENQYLDEFTTEQISNVLHLFGRRPPGTSKLGELKKMLATIRDASHSMMEYCRRLVGAVGRKEKWCEIFDRIRDMMENPYVGSDYHLLAAQKEKLYAIADFDSTARDEKLQTLRSVMVTLDLPAKSSLRVRQLCPALCLADWAALVPGGVSKVEDQVRVADLLPSPVCACASCARRCVSPAGRPWCRGESPRWRTRRFIEEGLRLYNSTLPFKTVTVITDSARRPCVITLVSARGARRRYMHKAGEPLLRDAALSRLCPPRYTVIPTSADSGLIEFLEDHETLFSLINSVCDLDEISMSVPRPADDELIVSPTPHAFQQLRDRVPVDALRTAVERNSSCFEDFLMKKRNFQDSLATMAISDWILGLGDRHLQNLLWSARSGGVVGVDGGAAMRGRELPAARLTPCLLALGDAQVLESRLQTRLSELRECQYLFCNFVKMSFMWDKQNIDERLPHIQALLSGRCLSRDVTRALLENSRVTYKHAYLTLIDDVFKDFERKEQYTVVEQISCFLVHCTSPRILQVTRAGWMPWV